MRRYFLGIRCNTEKSMERISESCLLVFSASYNLITLVFGVLILSYNLIVSNEGTFFLRHIDTDKPWPFNIIFSVLYFLWFHLPVFNFFSHLYLYPDKPRCHTFTIFSIHMKLELFSFILSSFPTFYLLPLFIFLPSLLPAFLSSLWKKVVTSSNNISILQLLRLIAIKLTILF